MEVYVPSLDIRHFYMKGIKDNVLEYFPNLQNYSLNLDVVWVLCTHFCHILLKQTGATLLLPPKKDRASRPPGLLHHFRGCGDLKQLHENMLDFALEERCMNSLVLKL